MNDAGIQPSNAMYNDILYFAQNCGGAECAAVIKERVGMRLCISAISVVILTRNRTFIEWIEIYTSYCLFSVSFH